MQAVNQDPRQTPTNPGENPSDGQQALQAEKLDMTVPHATYRYVRPNVHVNPDDPTQGYVVKTSSGKTSKIPVKGPFSMRIWNPRNRPAPQAVIAGGHMFLVEALVSDQLDFEPQMWDGVMIEIPAEELQRQLKSIKGGNRATKIRRNQVRDRLVRDGMLFLASDEESLAMLTDFCALMKAAFQQNTPPDNNETL